MIKHRGISDEQAREILQRAAEIDRCSSDVVSIDTLRAAAREAGIAESSFTAALSEHASREAGQERSQSRRRLVMNAFAGVGAAWVLVLGAALLTRIG